MELSQLKTFITVAEEQHLTRAAERLFTSQPAVSAQLKALEETLGVTLFDRTPKGMRLTSAGEKLLPQARSALDAANLVVSQAKIMRGEVAGKISVGVNSDFSFLRISKLLQEINHTYPGIALSFLNSNSIDIIKDIRKGKLDSGFFFGPCTSADLRVLFLAEINTAIVAPIAWTQKAQRASLEELAQLPWVYTTDQCPFYDLMEKLFEGTDLELSKAVFVDTEDATRELVKAGSGIALLRMDDADKAEKEGWGVRWSGDVPTISLSVAVQTRRAQEPVIQAWLKSLCIIWPDADALPQAQNTA